MLVVDDGPCDKAHLVPGLAQLVGQVGVLVVHEQVGAHSPDGSPRVGVDGAGAAAQAEDLGGGQRRVGGVQPGAVVAVAGAIDLVAGGVDEDLPATLAVGDARPAAAVTGDEELRVGGGGGAPGAGQEDERGRGAHGLAQGLQERVEESVAHGRVVVEQDDGIFAQAGRSCHDSSAESVVRPCVHEGHSRGIGGAAQLAQALAQDGQRVVVGSVVDDDEVVPLSHLRGDRVGGAQSERRVLPVDEDDPAAARPHRAPARDA